MMVGGCNKHPPFHQDQRWMVYVASDESGSWRSHQAIASHHQLVLHHVMARNTIGKPSKNHRKPYKTLEKKRITITVMALYIPVVNTNKTSYNPIWAEFFSSHRNHQFLINGHNCTSRYIVLHHGTSMVFPVISVFLQAKRARNCLSAAGSKAPLWDWSLTWSGIPGISLIRLGGESWSDHIASYHICDIYIYSIIMHIYIYICFFYIFYICCWYMNICYFWSIDDIWGYMMCNLSLGMYWI